MTTREREERLQPIRIPIYKGLIGWRVNLLRQTDSQLLSHVRTLDDLKALRFASATTGQTPRCCAPMACRWSPARAIQVCSACSLPGASTPSPARW